MTYANLRRWLADSPEDKLFPLLTVELQNRTYFEFGTFEDHYKYRSAVISAYTHAHFPVFAGFNHMQYQIQDPHGFASMLREVMEDGRLPELELEE